MRQMLRCCGGPYLRLHVALVLAALGGVQATLGAESQWVSISSEVPATPSVMVVSSDAARLVLEFQVPGYETDVVKRGPGPYRVLSLPEAGVSAAVGRPQLPVVRRLIEVAEGAQLSAEVQEAAAVVPLSALGLACPILPRQAPVPKVSGALKMAPFDLQAAAYQADAFAPASRVALVEAGHFAGRRLVLLELSPISYNPVRAELSVASRLTVTVAMKGGVKTTAALSSQEDTLLSGLTLNHSPTATLKSGARLLIIAHDSLAPYLTAFVAHKTSEGWTVDLFNTTTAGTTTTAIQSYIRSRYANPETRPDAVLLVGDTAQIPCFISMQADFPDTDLYYGCMDGGDDWQPELPVGRFSVSSSVQLEAIVSKTIYYETSPPAAYTARAAFLGSDDSTFWYVAEGTHNWCISNYLDPRGYLSDKLYAHTYGATSQQVRDALNEGRVFAIYSGHGSASGWGGPALSQYDVRSSTNANKYPFVCSFACLTGQFSQDECFAETWQRGASNGAVEVLASSVTSYWDEDDILQKKLFAALFDYNHWLFGEDVMQAKYLYLQHWGVTDTTHRYFEQYNVFGDPTVELKAPAFGIATSSVLAPAFKDETYSCPLMAVGGSAPYTWSISAGALPGGLSIDPSSGVIAGTATNIGTATFTVEVTDSALVTTNKQFQLSVVARLRVVCSKNLPAAVLNTPYSDGLQAQGGTAPYSWTADAVASYAESDPGTAWLGGGTAKGWHADDLSWSLTLPWPFLFYGSTYNSVWICSNGYIDFTSSAGDYLNTDAALIKATRIAPLWEDLVTTGDDDDIFVTTNATYVAIRWAAHTYSGNYPANAELVLCRDGSIKFNYGTAQSGLAGATIGVSRGDGTHYMLSTRDNANSLPANVSSLLTRTGLLPPGLTLSSSGLISGTPTVTGSYSFVLHVKDSGVVSQSCDQQFQMEVISAPTITGWSYSPATQCLLSFNSVTGRLYALEARNGLATADLWLSITDNLAGTGNPITVCDPDAGLFPRRFYRLRME